MKKTVEIFAAVAASMFALSCTPEFPTPDKNNLPQASNLTPVITVDQETNYVTFSIQESGVVPMWIFGEDKVDGKANKKFAYTGNGISLRIRDAGKHSVELKAYNANGISLGSQMVEYSLDNTFHDPFDPAPIVNDLVSNEWYWNKSENDHFGCGQSITAEGWPGLERYGLDWWACEANGKAEFSMYDDKMTFTSDGKYQYDPVDGKTYVNKDSGYKTQFKTGDEDYVADIDAFECNYTIEQEWNAAGIEELYLVLDRGANLSYIPNPEALSNPRYMILNHNKRLLTFVVDNGSISWRYQFAPKGKEQGLDYEADTNIWKPIDASESTRSYGFYYAPGWNQIADPAVTFSGDTYTIDLPEATTDQWQAQFHIDPNSENAIAIDASRTYAFSCLVQTNNTLPGMTFKLTDANSDSNYLFELKKEVAAGKEYLFEVKGVALTEHSAENMKLFFDFGGNAAGTRVSIRRITLQEYVAPASSINDTPFVGGKADLSLTKGDAVTLTGVEPSWWDPDFFEDGKFIAESGDYRIYNNESWLKVVPMAGGETASWDNGKALWIIGDGIHKPETNSAPGWATDEKVDLPFAKNGNVYQLTAYIDGPNFKVFGQANWGFELGGDLYTEVNANDFLTVNGFPGGTASDNGNIWSGSAFEAGWYVLTITDNGDGTFAFACDKKKDTVYEIDSESNLWKSATITPEFWYADGGWGQIADPEYEFGDGNSFTAVMPDGIGGTEWMGQNKLHSGIATSSDKIYDFCCTLLADEDCTITVKLTGNPEGEGDPHAFFYDGNVQLEAGVPFTYRKARITQSQSNNDFTVIFDYGRVHAGKTVSATQICFQEHIEK